MAKRKKTKSGKKRKFSAKQRAQQARMKRAAKKCKGLPKMKFRSCMKKHASK